MKHGIGTHHRTSEAPRIGRFIVWSLVLHVVMMVVFTFTLSHNIRMAPPAALQVRLVGVPQPKAQAQKKVEPEEIRTQDSAAPKEPPPDAKNMPDTDAQSKFALDDKKEKADNKKQQLVEAKKRPPELDKTPREKKVVKNKKDAKVVKDPENFLKALEFVDTLEKATPSPTDVAKSDKPAGEGPKIQLNLADQGIVDGVRSHIMEYWTEVPGKDVSALSVIVEVEIDEAGNVLAARTTDSSGDTAFDQSLVRAVRKASPLPIPEGKFETFQMMDLVFDGSSL